MSMEAHYYAIAGYDLSGVIKNRDLFDCEDSLDDFLCYKRVGNIQFFGDPASYSHLYFGYVFAEGDEYRFGEYETSFAELLQKKDEVDVLLKKALEALRVPKLDNFSVPEYKIFVFEEWR